MNRIFKVIWSKAKNCYIVASELAKSHTKAPASGVISHTIVAGILACILSCGVVAPVWAAAYSAGGGNASGTDAVSIGSSSVASGDTSLALGTYAKAYGQRSVAIRGVAGDSTNSDISRAIAIGGTSKGDHSVAIGFDSYAYGMQSLSLMPYSYAYGSYNVAIGRGTAGNSLDNPTSYSIAVGFNSVSSADASLAMGFSAKATNSYSVSLGGEAQATGAYSTAVGGSNTVNNRVVAAGTSSLALGYDSKAYGNNSIAIGGGFAGASYSTSAPTSTKTLDISIGYNSVASGGSSIAIGYGAHSKASSSLALGSGSVASANNTVSFGHIVGDSYTRPNSGDNGLYTDNLFRRLTNVADGTGDHDVATVGQMNAALASASTPYIGINSPSGGSNEDGGGATGTDAIAIGKIASSGGNFSVAIGQLSNASGNYSLSLGRQSLSSGLRSIAIGFSDDNLQTSRTLAQGIDSIAIGQYSKAFGGKSIAIGGGIAGGDAYPNGGAYTIPETTTGYDIAFGSNSKAYGGGATAIGNGARAYADSSLALGRYTLASGNYSTSLGYQAYAYGENSFAANRGIAHGNYSLALAGGIAGGSSANPPDTPTHNNIAIGQSAVASARDSIAFGVGSKAYGISSLALAGGKAGGDSSSVPASPKNYSIAIGVYSISNADDGIALGRSANVTASGAVALGYNSVADESNTLSVGNSSLKRRIVNVADGTDDHDVATVGQMNAALASASTPYIGINSPSGGSNEDGGGATGTDAIAIGEGAVAFGDKAISIGTGNQVRGDNSGAIGDPNIVNGDNSYVVGNNSSVDSGSSNVFVLGNKADVTGSNTVVLGGSSSDTAMTVSGSNSVILGTDSDGTVSNVISVGAEGSERRIIHVADGTSATDAATVGQTVELVEGANVTVTSKGKNSIGQNKYEISATDTTYTAGNGLELDGTEFKSKAGTNVVIDADGIHVAGNGTVSENNTGLMSGGAAYTELRPADGGYVQRTNTTAVNLAALDSQLKTVTDGLASEQTTRASEVTRLEGLVSAEESARETGDTAILNKIGSITADGNYITKDGTVFSNLSALDTQVKANAEGIENITGQVGSLDALAVKYDSTDKGKVTLAGTGGTVISNVKAGTLSADSMEAVNGSQLYTTNQNLVAETAARTDADTTLSNRIGTLSEDGTVIHKDDSVSKNLKALDESLAGIRMSGVVYDDTAHTAVTLGDGTTAVKLDNVADGTLSEDSMEAVNGSQLYTTNQNLLAEKIAREEADAALGERIGTVAEDGAYIKKSSTNNIAANLSALDVQMKASTDDILGLKDLSNITDSGKTVIRDLAKGTVKVASGNYTNIVKGTDGNADSYTVNVIANGEAAEGNTGLMTGGAVYTAVKGAVDAFSPANISDAAAAQWAERLGTGVVAQDSTGLVSGKTLYNEVHVSDGNVVRAANTVGQNLAALDAGLKTVGTDVADIKENALKYDDSGKTAVTLGDGTNAAAIHNLAAGELSAASKDAVNGSQLYSVRDKLQKADGIDKGKWQEVLGDGKVELDNTGLVTGDTVYKAIVDSSTAASVRMVGINSKDSTDTNYTGGGATGENAIAIGSGVEVSGDNAVAMGKDSRAGGAQSVAIGHGSQALGLQSVVIGTSNKVTGNYSGAFGDPNYVTGDNSYAFGNNNSVSGSNTFVLGNNVKASGKNSVVLGAGSDGSEDNVVSVGAKGNERRITHVADGQTMTDAATVGQLSRLAQAADNGLRYLDRRVNKAGAGAAALAALHPLDMDGKFGMAAGYGNYHSTHAMALGLFYQPKDNVMFSIGGTIGNGDNMINAGVSIALDKGFTNSKAAMARNIRNLTAENAAMKEKLEAQGNEIKELKEMLMQLKSQMQKQ